MAEVQKFHALQVCTIVAGRPAAVLLLPPASWTGPAKQSYRGQSRMQIGEECPKHSSSEGFSVEEYSSDVL